MQIFGVEKQVFANLFAYVEKKHYLCSGKGFIINTTMARPIRETPILFGDEARRFETQMLNPN